ncbi:hypothetical protein HDK90DRAFT_532132 [Phyllosticta capitalensis]|uniref:F-box domain-containing protein n=1 Tax=Phyllosticta capitalensis TaxID=121624 RepID=A0ABR1YW54_9PEZI
MAMRQMNVLDLPPEMVLHIGSFLPLSCLAAFGLTCRSTWDLFKGQVTNLRELEKANFLLLLHKDLPGWMICQNDMIIRRMDSCCDPGHGPSDNDYFHHKLRWFYDRNSKPVKSLIPVPSISQPLFMLDYGHVNKVMMRHRYGAKFVASLNEFNENGHALAFNGKILVPGESAKNFKSGLPVVGNELDDEDEMDMDDSG